MRGGHRVEGPYHIGVRTDEEDGGADPAEPLLGLALGGQRHDAREDQAHDHHGAGLGEVLQL